jgi:RNA polymerase sigma-70 factor (ECF subfamily)
VVEQDAERSMLAQSIEDAARQLSPGARTVFLLHDVEGYTHEEIAVELGITPGGSKSQLFKARAKLRRLLAPLVESMSFQTGQDRTYAGGYAGGYAAQ